MKLISWNVNGLRSILGKGLLEFWQSEQPDVLCLQEIKARPDQVADVFWPASYQALWNPARRAGYAGTIIFTRCAPLGWHTGIGEPEGDAEGRVITAEFPEFFLVTVYTPNSQRDLTRLSYRTEVWEPAFLRYVLGLQKQKPVIFCGDLNVAHQEIDLANPKSNTRNAGFTAEERACFDRVMEAGFIDTFRHFTPEGNGHYTWWSYMNQARPRNIGWRIDYFVTSPTLVPALCSSDILSDVMGSDHCPVRLMLKL